MPYLFLISYESFIVIFDFFTSKTIGLLSEITISAFLSFDPVLCKHFLTSFFENLVILCKWNTNSPKYLKVMV